MLAKGPRLLPPQSNVLSGSTGNQAHLFTVDYVHGRRPETRVADDARRSIFMQNGSIVKSRRKNGREVWEFRWRDRTLGTAIYRRIVLGTTKEFPNAVSARTSASGIVLEINRRDPRNKTQALTVREPSGTYLVGRKEKTVRAATLVGILLIILGIAGFAMGGISFTHEKKDVDLGPVQIQHKQKDTLPISPILSTIALIGGIGLVIAGSRAK